MCQVSLNMGMLQLAIIHSWFWHHTVPINKLSLQAFVCKFSDLPKFWITWKKCIIWTYWLYFSFHVQQHCQDEDFNTRLRKLVWLKRLSCHSVSSTYLLSQKMVAEFGFTSMDFLDKKSKNWHSNLVGGTTSLLQLKPHQIHSTVYK